jgi:signal peptidase I
MAKKQANQRTMPLKSATTRAMNTTPIPSTSFFLRPAVRESTESIVVAFVLAFLFRSFAAEAFVIPTGSMAPTLMGAHKDLLCPECGYRYQAGASSESEDVAQQRGFKRPIVPIAAVTCPLCRYVTSVDPRTAAGREYPTYGGDRILVSKFSVELGEPRRWDVTVFKYPGEAQTNYIKRLVGLPNETVRIWHGDLYFKSAAGEDFRFDRREPAKLRAMAQVVYDNDYVVDSMSSQGWPLRWAPSGATSADTAAVAAWSSDDGGRSYETDGGSHETQWLGYRHYVPSVADWRMLKRGHLPDDFRATSRLITDFVAYNTSVPEGDQAPGPQQLGLHWVGDLMIECQLDVTKADGKVDLDLVKGGRHFRATLDVLTGEARLSIPGVDSFKPQAKTVARGPGRYHVMFANFDRQLVLWVNGTPVVFDTTTTYESLENERPQSSPDDPGDLEPARIGAEGTAVRVSHIRLLRDIYYIATSGGLWVADYDSTSTTFASMSYDKLLEFWSTPSSWSQPKGNLFDERREALFPLAPDQFFVLGDNSPLSQDARLWTGQRYVSRELLVGKALFIFWPHSFDKLPGTNLPFPFFPNFARMRFIR